MILMNENRIKVVNSTTDDSIQDIKTLFSTGQVRPETIHSAHIQYDSNKGIGEYGGKRYYPLILKGDTFEILVSCVTAGYRGQGPHGTIEVLKAAGFNVTPRTEKIIFSTKRTNHYLFKKR